jgi:hypothetical protein
VNGHEDLRAHEELRQRIAPFLAEGEEVDVAIPASARPGRALRAIAVGIWPFFHERDRFLLVATDRRWVILESSRERLRGDLRERASLPRDIEVTTSWFTRFDGFDRPYAIDPTYRRRALAASRARAERAESA